MRFKRQSTRMQISIQNRQKKYRMNRKKVLQWVQEILLMQKYEAGEVGIVFVNNRQIQKYNWEYRQKDRPTDVLSFPMLEGAGGELHPQFLGDVMISLERIEKDAGLLGRSCAQHLLSVLIHGLLHLIGYDHERSSQEEKRMRRRENYLFKKLSRTVL
jgi:rRNA maturation RNase YbeY